MEETKRRRDEETKCAEAFHFVSSSLLLFVSQYACSLASEAADAGRTFLSLQMILNFFSPILQHGSDRIGRELAEAADAGLVHGHGDALDGVQVVFASGGLGDSI